MTSSSNIERQTCFLPRDLFNLGTPLASLLLPVTTNGTSGSSVPFALPNFPDDDVIDDIID